MDLFSSVSREFFEYPLEGAKILYCNEFYSVDRSQEIFENLMGEIGWDQEYINIYGKKTPLPRLTSWHGFEGKSYSYSGIFSSAKPFTKTLKEIKGDIEEALLEDFNSVLLNFYRDGNDSISWHSDDEPELGESPMIASLSLGGERLFKFKNKITNEIVDLRLGSGSLLIMKGDTQRNWLHQISKTKTRCDPRINLTFRYIY